MQNTIEIMAAMAAKQREADAIVKTDKEVAGWFVVISLLVIFGTIVSVVL